MQPFSCMSSAFGRISETRRDFKQPPELRRLVKYRQGIAIVDTADPILFRFLPRADNGDVAVPARRLLDPPQTLAEAVQAMADTRLAQKLSAATPVQSNGNSKDGTALDEFSKTDAVQPNQQMSLPETDSVTVRPKLRMRAFPNSLLPFQPQEEQE